MKRIFLLLLLVLSVITTNAQLSTSSKKAEKLYKETDFMLHRRMYPEAIEKLKEALDKDEDFYEAHLRIASCYKILNYYAEAQSHYEKAIAIAPEKMLNTFYNLAEALYLQGKYPKALDNINQFLSKITPQHRNYTQANDLLENIEFAVEMIKDPLDFTPEPMNETVNHFALQYFPVLTADQKSIIYTGRVGSSAQHDEDIYISRKNQNDEWSIPASISENINSRFNEGTCTISADGRMLIFTSCLGRKTYGSCDLFVSYKTGDQWSRPENLGSNINSRAWESQPSLSADGRTLYFISNRPGGIGQRDIWVSYLHQNGEWSKAVNLGSEINTSRDEVSPFIHVNGKTLFFSSKGYPSMGGFDLYYAEKMSSNDWTKPKNLGYPINTHEDQVSLFITPDAKKAYYSVDARQEGLLVSSKIYAFDLPPEIKISSKSNFVAGQVYDRKSKDFLEASVELFDLQKDSLVSMVNSDPVNGEYMMVLNEGANYALYVNKQGYLFKSLSFDYEESANPEPLHIDIPLDPIEKGSVTTLKNIFFDLDKYELKEQSITELRKVAEFLKNNKEVEVEISGHTDDTGTEAYNMELSKNRAKAVYDFLVESQINPQRLSYQGFGQNKPLVPNDSEKNRSLNRRIEFEIL